MLDIDSAAIDVHSKNTGVGADAAESRLAGNLSKVITLCLMMARNGWGVVGLVNSGPNPISGR